MTVLCLTDESMWYRYRTEYGTLSSGRIEHPSSRMHANGILETSATVLYINPNQFPTFPPSLAILLPVQYFLSQKEHALVHHELVMDTGTI